MFKTLFRKSTPHTNCPSVPEGRRVYAIGDVHGRLDLLTDLFERISIDDADRDPADTEIILLGDLIDRGPYSRQVIDDLIRRKAEGLPLRILLGNHEEVFLSVLDGDRHSLRLFARIGGRETILSYGLKEAEYRSLDFDQLERWLTEHVPHAHRAFLTEFEDLIVIGDYAFVHAGVDPMIALDRQRPDDLRWIRDKFLDYRGELENRIVHGHTISSDVEFRSHRIGIDTGAYASGKLTALGLQGTSHWLLQTAGEPSVAANNA